MMEREERGAVMGVVEMVKTGKRGTNEATEQADGLRW